MKKLLYILLFVPIALFGQDSLTSDSLYFIDGKVEGVEIIEIDDSNVKYKGGQFTISTSLKYLYKIKTINGRLIEFENLDWKINYYVDDFGDKTNTGYITNITPIIGTFSNSATTNSDLSVRILVSDSSSVDIILNEYGTMRVKAYSAQAYSVKIKLDDNSVATCWAHMDKNSDRLSVDSKVNFWGNPKGESKLHNILMNNNDISIVIKEPNSLTEYKFSFENIGYSNIYNNLHPKIKREPKIDSKNQEILTKKDNYDKNKVPGIYYNNTKCLIVEELSIESVKIKCLNETGRAYDKYEVLKSEIEFFEISYEWKIKNIIKEVEKSIEKVFKPTKPGLYYMGANCVILKELPGDSLKIKYLSETGRAYYRKIIGKDELIEIKE